MPNPHYSSFKEFENLTDDQLRELADNSIRTFTSVSYSPSQDTALLLQAQLYMNELARRNDERVARRDYLMARESHSMEKWVIGLIGLEILLSVVGLVLGWVEGAHQEVVLRQLAENTRHTSENLESQKSLLQTMTSSIQETAKAIGKLNDLQDDSLGQQKKTLGSTVEMNHVLHQQLDLDFRVAINVVADDSEKTLIVENATKTAVYLWGVKWGDDPPLKFSDERFIPPGADYNMHVADLYDIAIKNVPKNQTRRIPLMFFVKNANGKPYINRGFVVQRWFGDALKFLVTSTSLREEEWPPEVK